MHSETGMKGQTIVRWEFTRDGEHVTCQVKQDARTGAFAVLMYSDLQRASMEVFQLAAAAFRRLAIIAAELRASGWKLDATTA